MTFINYFAQNWKVLILLFAILIPIIFIASVAIKNYTQKQIPILSIESLIEYISQIVPNFKNQRDLFYDSQRIKYSLRTSIFQRYPQRILFITKNIEIHHNMTQYSYILRWSINQIFPQFQDDWSRRDFNKMEKYIDKNELQRLKNIYYFNFKNGWDIRFDNRIEEFSVLWKSHNDEYRVQLNMSAILITIGTNWLVWLGNEERKFFTEYWDVKFAEDNKLILLKIIDS